MHWFGSVNLCSSLICSGLGVCKDKGDLLFRACFWTAVRTEAFPVMSCYLDLITGLGCVLVISSIYTPQPALSLECLKPSEVYLLTPSPVSFSALSNQCSGNFGAAKGRHWKKRTRKQDWVHEQTLELLVFLSCFYTGLSLTLSLSFSICRSLLFRVL